MTDPFTTAALLQKITPVYPKKDKPVKPFVDQSCFYSETEQQANRRMSQMFKDIFGVSL